MNAAVAAAAFPPLRPQSLHRRCTLQASSSNCVTTPTAAHLFCKPLNFHGRHSLRVSSSSSSSSSKEAATTESLPHPRKLIEYSSRIIEPKSLADSQAVLYGVGLSDDDMQNPQNGISSVCYPWNTCNKHLLRLAEAIKLPVREDAAVMAAQWYDGDISIPGCDKNIPGTIMAVGRLNRPRIMVYGGTIKEVEPSRDSFETMDGLLHLGCQAYNINSDPFDGLQKLLKADNISLFCTGGYAVVDNGRDLARLNKHYGFESHGCAHLPYGALNIENLVLYCDSCSAHMLWACKSTRPLNGAHVEFLRGQADFFGIKVRDRMDPKELVRLCEILNPGNRSGRLTIIIPRRAEDMPVKLSHLIRAAHEAGLIVTLVSDPMHGNTIKAPCDLRTEIFSAIKFELKAESSDEMSSYYHTQGEPRLNARQLNHSKVSLSFSSSICLSFSLILSLPLTVGMEILRNFSHFFGK